MEADNEKPEVKPEVAPEALIAAGQSCLAMATAITSLTQKDLLEEAKDLTEQLRQTAKALRWLIRENRVVVSDTLSKIDTKGIDLDRDSKVCQFIRGFLENGERKAIDVINKSVDMGYSKNEVFKAKEVLKLEVSQRRANKWWSLPKDPVSEIELSEEGKKT